MTRARTLLRDPSGFTGAEKALALCFGLGLVAVTGHLLRGGSGRAAADAERTLASGAAALGANGLGQPLGAAGAIRAASPEAPAPEGGRPEGPGGPGAPEAPARILPVHFKGAATFDGPYQLTAAALAGAYRGVSAEKFGTTDVKLPTGQAYNVRDMHYALGEGRYGMRLIPVSDSGTVLDAQGQAVPGHQVMDAHLRREMGLKETGPIFALIAYVHPEQHSGDLKGLGGDMLKTEMGATHMGAYLGGGVTSNAPEEYHQRRWNVRGYPANVQVVSLVGVDQATLNRNALLADAVLNKGVKFPPDYKNDQFYTTSLNTTLQFYRDWIRGEAYLKDDPAWRTYCAEHKTIVTNVMLNVPHNERAFKEIFGDAEGAKLWAQFKDKYKADTGRDFTAADETDFEPLWKKEGLKAEAIRPMTYEQWKAYETARKEGKLDSYSGPVPLAPGRAMAWAPESTADLINAFAQTYTSFADTGGVVASSVLLGFKDTIKERTGLSDKEYLGLALPIVNKIMVADAMVGAKDDPAWLQKATAGLYVAYGGKVEDLGPGGTPNPQLLELAKSSLRGAEVQLPQIMTQPKKTPDEAYAWLRKAVQPDLERARAQAVVGDKVEFYSPPAVAHRVSIGLGRGNPLVTIRTVGTAVDMSELELKKPAPPAGPTPAPPPAGP